MSGVRVVPEKSKVQAQAETQAQKLIPITLKDDLHNKIKIEYYHYKHNLEKLEKILREGQSLIFTSNFWTSQKDIEIEFIKLWKLMNKEKNPYNEILIEKFQNLKFNYKKILVYLYNADKLKIADDLEDDEDVCAFFQIRKRIIRFSQSPIVHIIPKEDTRESTIEYDN